MSLPLSRPSLTHPAQLGLSLIELVIFIVVVSAALAGVLRVFMQAGASSADPQLQRQALAVAESLLQEVQLMPFTFCQATDANVETATSSAIGPTGCASLVENIGPEGGETRSVSPQFDNVNDYHGYSMNGIVDIGNTAVPGLAGYSANVTVVGAALGSISAASGDALLITVTVNGPSSTQIVLTGYRGRYAPNAAL